MASMATDYSITTLSFINNKPWFWLAAWYTQLNIYNSPCDHIPAKEMKAKIHKMAFFNKKAFIQEGTLPYISYTSILEEEGEEKRREEEEEGGGGEGEEEGGTVPWWVHPAHPSFCWSPRGRIISSLWTLSLKTPSPLLPSITPNNHIGNASNTLGFSPKPSLLPGETF